MYDGGIAFEILSEKMDHNRVGPFFVVAIRIYFLETSRGSGNHNDSPVAGRCSSHYSKRFHPILLTQN